jgi:hypothetical protein
MVMRKFKSDLLIQCKTNGRIDPHERQALVGHAIACGAIAVLAWRVRPGLYGFRIINDDGELGKEIEP